MSRPATAPARQTRAQAQKVQKKREAIQELNKAARHVARLSQKENITKKDKKKVADILSHLSPQDALNFVDSLFEQDSAHRNWAPNARVKRTMRKRREHKKRTASKRREQHKKSRSTQQFEEDPMAAAARQAEVYEKILNQRAKIAAEKLERATKRREELEMKDRAFRELLDIYNDKAGRGNVITEKDFNTGHIMSIKDVTLDQKRMALKSPLFQQYKTARDSQRVTMNDPQPKVDKTPTIRSDVFRMSRVRPTRNTSAKFTMLDALDEISTGLPADDTPKQAWASMETGGGKRSRRNNKRKSDNNNQTKTKRNKTRRQRRPSRR